MKYKINVIPLFLGFSCMQDKYLQDVIQSREWLDFQIQVIKISKRELKMRLLGR